ncbi:MULTISPECIES: DUF885 domain-containing protein [unclassified Solwaraspora]|uniref:DUF885 domain-containing protein n=1 Tax=unclassified Solwaraspora TaxID=2627926 RepID=UPI00248B08AC|nr:MULTISPECIES: DUF885 domain-containing protein [unclassified Solwaraspora]WBB97247.1 DUF885 domain-containing protein [Solwaraspora sp. WMMA2059]WBC18852.1 DUF885 domain-containing protein [Solwaraspora sp. WMMA2080]WJK33756.1 DUF885 domain-containing protein [Solwaraspora sp. WMMA2065]
MGRVDDISNSFVERWARLNPIGATYIGVDGHDDQLDDLSPDGYAERAALTRDTLRQLDVADPESEAERVARDAMAERLGLELARYEAGEETSELSVITSGLHHLRQVFDLMPTEGTDAMANIAARLDNYPQALDQVRVTLLDAARAGHVAPRAQMLKVADQCDVWTDPEADDFFHALVGRLSAPATLTADLRRAASAATAATIAFGRFLRTELAPLGRDTEAAGRDRYELASQYFLGARIDLDETYAWGFFELDRIEQEMRRVAAEIAGRGASIDDAVRALDADPARTIAGGEAFRDWMQALADRAIEELHGSHFDIPQQIRRIECCLAPTSDGGIYYTGPSEDFSRPGRMWWAVPHGLTEFSTWREVTTVYHEGVPGHHLQIGQTQVRADLLNRWQRLLCWCSGHSEGWALYAERLMDELGYLADPGDRLGMLDGQALRAARVIVDIGLHLQLTIPPNSFNFHPGERWTPELAWQFLRAHCQLPDEILRFELDRYLGWPGQAAAYKVGERIWLQARADAQARKGAAFNLKEFHQAALNLGVLGLDPLRSALARI